MLSTSEKKNTFVHILYSTICISLGSIPPTPLGDKILVPGATAVKVIFLLRTKKIHFPGYSSVMSILREGGGPVSTSSVSLDLDHVGLCGFSVFRLYRLLSGGGRPPRAGL